MKPEMLFSTFPFLSCKKVTLSRISDLDAESLWEIMSDDDNFQYTPEGPLYSIEAVARRIAKYDYQFKLRESVVLGIFSNLHLNKLIGTLTLSDIDVELDAVTLSIMLNQEYIRQGNASAAIDATTKFLFDVVKFNRVQAYVMPNNLPCQRLFERCGFVKEGTIREGFLWPDKGLVDLDIFSMLPIDHLKHENRTEERRHYKF